MEAREVSFEAGARIILEAAKSGDEATLRTHLGSLMVAEGGIDFIMDEAPAVWGEWTKMICSRLNIEGDDETGYTVYVLPWEAS